MATKKRPVAARSKDTLQEELDKVRSSLLSREELDPISAAAEAKRKSELAAQLGKVTSKAVTEKLGALSLDTQNVLDSLRTTLISSTQELEELREMISIESERLEELYGKDVVASSVATLIAEYDQKKALFQEEEAGARAALKTSIDEQKKLEAERKAATEKQRKQEQEEYDYNLTKQRREVADEFARQLASLKQQEADRHRELERGWKDREEVLLANENEIVAMREKIAGFDAVLIEEKKKAVDTVTRAMSIEHKHQLQLLETTAKAAQDLLHSENKSLSEDNARLRMAISELQTKLETANDRVESIAKSAMERDSGQAALAASQRTAEILRDSQKK